MALPQRSRPGRVYGHRVDAGGWDYDAHPGGCCPRVEAGVWEVCCRECAGTGVWPVPWIGGVMEGIARYLAGLTDASCVSCKATGRAQVAFASQR